ncbi:MAG: radical SAM protein [Planctomycetota bacterium]|jgi:wyosine [tRNA(Phe)-imidazoG37] synthetase (radical SAM superfamily)|nr:radical SAM protein [Planctomycetota bacterium]MEC7429581.1 radical SAM protein [Planctomycetota bacterium]MEC7447136.1 radical SAM protein [Planctomycetota bacterium]MEC7447837.1 radical SAM protein [Planctomycetota bacterium]MEC7499240.1 radical SAM protein [Planctomycetota bacterium]
MNQRLFQQHSRNFEQNRFVYPVISRRSGGVSIGVNLNPDKVCNFDCIYCQVDRTRQSETRFVETDALLTELRGVLELVVSGDLFELQRFSETPPSMRRLNDIAFSGDGEPTTFRNFDEIIQACAEVRQDVGATESKMVLITNASMFHRPHVQNGLEILDRNCGEIWAKLDAGTEEYFQIIDRTKFTLKHVMGNLVLAAKLRPIVIQSLWMRVDDEPPTIDELEAYSDRLNEIVSAGGEIKLVQIYTVARQPAESYVSPLTNDEVDFWVNEVRRRTRLNVAGFYGVST